MSALSQGEFLAAVGYHSGIYLPILGAPHIKWVWVWFTIARDGNVFLKEELFFLSLFFLFGTT